MKKLLFAITTLSLFSAALVVGTLTLPLAAAQEYPSADDENEEVACGICFTEHSKDSIVIQQDCTHPDNQHFCLPCSAELAVNISGNGCPICRNKAYKIHDPRVRKDSYTYVHHRQKPLNAEEQALLRAYLNKVNHRLSLKAAPDTVKRDCACCKTTVEKNAIVIELNCGHSLCLRDAAKQVIYGTLSCPQCMDDQATIIDPLEFDQQKKVTLKYLLRVPTKEEMVLLQKVRSISKLFQEHISLSQRVPVQNRNTPTKTHSNQKKMGDEFNRIPRPTDYSTGEKHLPIVAGIYPLTEVTPEDTKLNTDHLPKHLNPQLWQVICVPSKSGIGTELARIKRATSAPEKFSKKSDDSSSRFSSSENQDLLKGYRGDLLAGLSIGLLIGQDFHKADRFTPKPLWLLYGAATYGAYHLVQQNNPERPFKGKYALRWAAGIGAGIAVQAAIGSK